MSQVHRDQAFALTIVNAHRGGGGDLEDTVGVGIEASPACQLRYPYRCRTISPNRDATLRWGVFWLRLRYPPHSNERSFGSLPGQSGSSELRTNSSSCLPSSRTIPSSAISNAINVSGLIGCRLEAPGVKIIHCGVLAMRSFFPKNIFAKDAAFSDTNLAHRQIRIFPPQNTLFLPPHRDCTLSKSLQITVILSILISSICSAAPAQPPRRGPRQPGQFRPHRLADRLKQGDMAPDFTLKSPDGKQAITLSDYRGVKSRWP